MALFNEGIIRQKGGQVLHERVGAAFSAIRPHAKPLALPKRLGYVGSTSTNQIMMKLLLARFLLAFMLLWLPLQGYAAQSMHSCPKHRHDEVKQALNAMPACHEHSADHAAKAPLKANLACDDCSSCHLMAQPALAVSPLMLGIDTVKLVQPTTSVNFLPFFPEQPQRPPLSLFS